MLVYITGSNLLKMPWPALPPWIDRHDESYGLFPHFTGTCTTGSTHCTHQVVRYGCRGLRLETSARSDILTVF